eukprot:PITA_13098
MRSRWTSRLRWETEQSVLQWEEVPSIFTGRRANTSATDVLHVLGLGVNLISISQLQDKGYDVHFIGKKVFVKQPSWKRVRQNGVRSNRLYRLQLDSSMALASSDNSSRTTLNELWHRRMGHLHHGALKMLREIVTGVPKFGTEHNDVCKGCVPRKYAKVAFPRSDNRADEKSIRREWTAPSNPQQNGVAERKNRTIVGATKAILYDQDLPRFIWEEACNTTVYIQNGTPRRALGKKTLERVFIGKKPKVSHFRNFSSIAYCHVLDEKRTKLNQTAEKGFLVGYSKTSKAYRIYIPSNRKIVVR